MTRQDNGPFRANNFYAPPLPAPQKWEKIKRATIPECRFFLFLMKNFSLFNVLIFFGSFIKQLWNSDM